MKRSLLDLLFDLIGKLCFPRQQAWQQRRSAKIMFGTVAVGILLGIAVVWLIKHMNSVRR